MEPAIRQAAHHRGEPRPPLNRPGRRPAVTTTTRASQARAARRNRVSILASARGGRRALTNANRRIFRVAAMRPEPMAWPVGEVAQCWIGITTGPGGEELILAGDVTPLMEIEMGYTPAGSEAKSCGTVKLIWNSPTATSAAALAGIATAPTVTVTPLKNVVEISVPAGDGAKPVA